MQFELSLNIIIGLAVIIIFIYLYFSKTMEENYRYKKIIDNFIDKKGGGGSYDLSSGSDSPGKTKRTLNPVDISVE